MSSTSTFETQVNTLFTGTIAPSLLTSIRGIRQELNKLNTGSTKASAGVTKFSKSLTGLRKNASGVKAQLKATASGMRDVAGASSKLKNELSPLATAFQTLGNYMLAGAMYTAFIKGTRDAIGVIVEFDQSLKNIQAITGATASEITQIGDTLKNVATTSKFSLVELSGAFKTIGQAGFEAKEGMDMIHSASELAIGTVTDLERTVDILTTTIRAYGLTAQDSEMVADVMTNAVNKSKLSIDKLRTAFNYVGKTASMAGLNIKDTAAAMMVLANNGLRASTLGTGFRQVLAKMIAPTKELRNAIRLYGLSLDDINPKIVGFRTALSNIRLVLRNTKDGTMDMGKAFKYFKLRGAQVAAALAKDAAPGGVYDKMRQRVEEIGTAAENAAKISEGLGYKWDNLKSKAGVLAEAIGDAGVTNAIRVFLDALREATEMLTAFVQTDFGAFVINVVGAMTTFMGLVGAVRLLNGAFKLLIGLDILGWFGGLATGLSTSVLNIGAFHSAIDTLILVMLDWKLYLGKLGTALLNWKTYLILVSDGIVALGESLLAMLPQLTLLAGAFVFAGTKLKALYDLWKQHQADGKAQIKEIEKMKQQYKLYTEQLDFTWKKEKEVYTLRGDAAKEYAQSLRDYLSALLYRMQILEKEHASTKRVKEEIERVVAQMKILKKVGVDAFDLPTHAVKNFGDAMEHASTRTKGIVSALNSILGKYAEYKASSEAAAAALKKESKAVKKLASAYSTTFNSILTSIKTGYSNQLTVIKNSIDQRLALIKQGIQEEKAANSSVADVYSQAYEKVKQVTTSFITESLSKLRNYETKRIALARATGESVAKILADTNKKRQDSYKEAISAYKDMIDQMISEEERLRDKIKQLTDWSAKYRNSLAGGKGDVTTEQDPIGKQTKAFEKLISAAHKASRAHDIDAYMEKMSAAKKLLDNLPKDGYKTYDAWGKLVTAWYADEKDVQKLRERGYKKLEETEKHLTAVQNRRMRREKRELERKRKDGQSQVKDLESKLSKLREDAKKGITLEFEADTSKIDTAIADWERAHKEAIKLPVLPEDDVAVKFLNDLRTKLLSGDISPDAVPKVPVTGDEESLKEWLNQLSETTFTDTKLKVPVEVDPEAFKKSIENLFSDHSVTSGANDSVGAGDGSMAITIPVRADDEELQKRITELKQKYNSKESEDGLYITFYTKLPPAEDIETDIKKVGEEYQDRKEGVNELNYFLKVDTDAAKEEVTAATEKLNEDMQDSPITLSATLDADKVTEAVSTTIEKVEEEEEATAIDLNANLDKEQAVTKVEETVQAINEAELSKIVLGVDIPAEEVLTNLQTVLDELNGSQQDANTIYLYASFEDGVVLDVVKKAIAPFQSANDTTIIYIYPQIDQSAYSATKQKLQQLTTPLSVSVTAVPHVEQAMAALRKLAAPITPLWSPKVDSSAIARIKNVIAQLKKPIHTTWIVHKKVVTSKSGSSKSRSTARHRTGGEVQKYREGGQLPGYGGGDKVKAYLEAGEFVVRKEAVQAYGTQLFDKYNKMLIKPTQKFANGGFVWPSMPSTNKWYEDLLSKLSGQSSKGTSGTSGTSGTHANLSNIINPYNMAEGYTPPMPRGTPAKRDSSRGSTTADSTNSLASLDKFKRYGEFSLADFKEAFITLAQNNVHSLREIVPVLSKFSHLIINNRSSDQLKEYVAIYKMAGSWIGKLGKIAYNSTIIKLFQEAQRNIQAARGARFDRAYHAKMSKYRDGGLVQALEQMDSTPAMRRGRMSPLVAGTNVVNNAPDMGTLHLNIGDNTNTLTATADSIQQLQQVIMKERLRRPLL